MRVCLLPAAGASSRMRGGDKLLEEIEGRACLTVMIERASAAGAQVLVTLPSPDHARAHALQGTGARTVLVPDAAEGMAASLRAGALACPDGTSGLMVLPPDMPALETDDLKKLWDRFETSGAILVQASTEGGTPGHPVIFGASLLNEFNNLSGDKGAAAIVARHADNRDLVPLAGNRARLDLDTPEDWSAWRSQHRGGI